MKKILIIEDDAIVGKLLQMKFIQTKKYEVFRAFDGEEGMQLVNKHNPDLILLDLAMPKKNGFEVMEEINIKYAKSAKRPYIIITSNLSGANDREKATKLGADEFISKSSSTIGAIVEASEQRL